MRENEISLNFLQPDSDGDRYFMLLTVFDESSIVSGDLDGASVGMEVFYDTGNVASDLEPVAKMMVGNAVSSKMVVMPVDGYAVEGVCSADCSGISSLSDEDKVRFLSSKIDLERLKRPASERLNIGLFRY